MRSETNPTRGELNDTKDNHSEELDALEKNLERKAEDIEVVRETQENLDLEGGTAEGAEQIENAVEGAGEVAGEVFDEGDADLTRSQDDTAEFQGGVEDLRAGSERDLGKLSDASQRIESDQTNAKLRESKEAALEDQDELQKLESSIEDSIENSKKVLEQLRAIRR